MYHKLPSNMRIFAEQLFGVDGPITEQDFSTEELAAMRRMIEDTERKNTEKEAQERQLLQLFEDNPVERELAWYRERGFSEQDVAEIRDSYEQHRAEQAARVASYDNSRGRTAVYPYFYYDYRGYNDGSGPLWLQAVKDSFVSPEYNLATSIGSFVAQHNPDGSISINDLYDWTDVGEVTAEDILSSLPHIMTKPEALGNTIMRLVKPEKPREFKIKLPPNTSEGASTTKATGGLIDMPSEYSKGRWRLI